MNSATCVLSAIPLYFAWETKIDFQEWVLPLYFSLDIAVILFPFIFRSWQDAIAPVGTLLAQTAVAAIFFVLIPIDPGYETSGVWGAYFYDYFWSRKLVSMEPCPVTPCCICGSQWHGSSEHETVKLGSPPAFFGL